MIALIALLSLLVSLGILWVVSAGRRRALDPDRYQRPAHDTSPNGRALDILYRICR